MNTNPNPAAILWDMDGTLVDTEPYWIRAETDLCREFGASWSHGDGADVIGQPLSATAEVLQGKGVDLPITDIVDRLLRQVKADVERHIPWQEDSRRLLDRAIGRGIPCALVTMSYALLADALLAKADVFQAVVTGDIVVNGKPHPEPYLTAAALLGVPIERCLAIEDSSPGVASAHASGARTVGVVRMIPIDPLPGLSRVRSIDSLTDEGIAEIMAGGVIDDFACEPAG